MYRQFAIPFGSFGIAVCLAFAAPLSAQEPKPRAVFEGHVEGVESVAFSPDGKTLASASAHCSIKLWDLASGRNTASVKEVESGAKTVLCLAISADGQMLASGGRDKKIKLWDIAKAK